ncbi:MAG: hypothetical protein IE889_01775 [Campylobacterales bacterium]|nr:hypothetical protein [Campylobacterales bacterium]
MIKKTLLALSLLVSFSTADNIRPLLQFAWEGGGDELVTIQHDHESDYTIKAGDGIAFEAGMAIDNPMSNLELQFLAGYKFDSDSASNGDITWSMVPLTALAMFKVQDWKLGGGVTYHMNPELDGRFDNDSINYKFDDALGAMVQIQYSPIDVFSIGLRGTAIQYKLTSDTSQTADGTSIGIVGTFKFGGDRYRYR